MVAGGTLDAAEAPGKAAPLILENSHVRMAFDAEYGGLTSLKDVVSGAEHIQATPAAHALWEMAWTRDNAEVKLANTQHPCASAKVADSPGGARLLTILWPDLPLGGDNERCAVEVTVELPAASGIAAWRIKVANKSRGWGLGQVDFPRITGMLEAGRYDLSGTFGHTETWGSLYRNYKGRLAMRYPDGWRGMSCQYVCANRGRSGVYLAAHDGRAWYKEFVIEPGNECFIRTYAENSGVAGSDYQAPYPAMLGVFQGDWLTGSKIYRKFAITAPWAAKGKVATCKETPQAMKDVGLWLRESDWTLKGVGDQAGMMKQVAQAKEYFGVPLGFHWYNWQVAAFDTQYPHMFPAKPGVDSLVKDMVNSGLLVMPYINGRIVDRSNKDFADYVPCAAKDRKGGTFTEVYGNNVPQAPMCPYTPFWQDKVAGNVEQLVAGLGVNAVYIDQISAGPPYLCFDKSHGHPLGGGSWWVDGYREMLKKARACAHANDHNAVITSECTAEPFMDGLDAFLTVNERTECSIPVLPAIYSGYTIYFASSEGALKTLSDSQWVMELGRDFLWGCQNGWFGFNLFRPENEAKKAYLRTLGKARVAGGKYLTYGELVGLFDDGTRSDFRNTPFVEGSIWKGEDGSLGVVIANYKNQEGTVSYVMDPSVYGLDTGNGYRSTRLHPDAAAPLVLPAGVIRLEETLGPLEIRILEIAPGKRVVR